MHYRMILAYYFAWYPRNERHHNQKSKRHWWDCRANIPNVLGTHHLYCCRSHTSILAGASQITLKWGKKNRLLSKMIPISWWEHHKKLVQVMLHLSHASSLGHKLMEKKSVHNLQHSPLPYLYISLRASYNLIDEQQSTVLRCSKSHISNVGWRNYPDEHVNFSPLRLTIIHIDSDGIIFMESFLQCGQHGGTTLQGTKRPLKI